MAGVCAGQGLLDFLEHLPQLALQAFRSARIGLSSAGRNNAYLPQEPGQLACRFSSRGLRRGLYLVPGRGQSVPDAGSAASRQPGLGPLDAEQGLLHIDHHPEHMPDSGVAFEELRRAGLDARIELDHERLSRIWPPTLAGP